MSEYQYDNHVQYYYAVWLGVMTKIMYGQTFIRHTKLPSGTIISEIVDPNTLFVHQVWSV